MEHRVATGDGAEPASSTVTATRTDTGRAATAPRLFVSYRRDDTGDVVAGLADMLREDVGDRFVYRDQDDMILGQPWKATLFREIEAANAVLALIGPAWTGPPSAPVGHRRIDAADDTVRAEVRATLTEDSTTALLPVLVDLDDFPDLPEDLTRIADHHRVQIARDDLIDGTSVGYHQILVGAWMALKEQLAASILIIDGGAEADFGAFVAALHSAEAPTARKLSRLGSSAVAVPRELLKEVIDTLPDVIVVTDSEDDELTDALKVALADDPRINSVATIPVAVLIGALGGGAVTLAVTSQLGATTFASGGTSSAAVDVGAAAGLGIGAKVAIGTAVLAGGAFGINQLVADDGLAIEFAASSTVEISEEDERFFPFGGPPDQAEVRLGEPTLLDDGARVRRSVVVRLPGEEPIELGEVAYPTTASPELLAAADADGVVPVAVVRSDVPLSFGELVPAAFCHRDTDQSVLTGSYRFIGDAGLVTAVLFVQVEDDLIAGTDIEVQVGAAAELVPLDPNADENLARCVDLARQGLSVTWRG